MIFKARITTPGFIAIDEHLKTKKVKAPLFIFTKNFIKFPGKLVDPLAPRNVYPYNGTHLVVDYMKYREVVKLTKYHPQRTKHSRFQISFEGGETVNLIMNEWNVFRFNCVHKRYEIQKHWEWFWKTILTIIIGAAIGVICNRSGYKQGYKDGVTAGEQKITDTNPQ